MYFKPDIKFEYIARGYIYFFKHKFMTLKFFVYVNCVASMLLCLYVSLDLTKKASIVFCLFKFDLVL